MLRKPSLSYSIFHYNIRRFCSKPIFITTPIFYVNDKPHIGHLYTSLLADSLSRWFKINEKKVLFSTGTDEHGLKIQKEAKLRNINEPQHCDKHSLHFKELFDTFNIKYDRFIRTTEDSHIKSAKHLWLILDQNGFIKKGQYSGWYSTTDEEFLTDNDINIESNGSVTSKITGSIVEKTQEENYLFNMDKIRNKLLSWASSDSRIEPKEKINQVIHAINNITSELSISRDRKRVHWGIECPSDNTQTMYVWLDALSNYLTVAGFPDKSFLNVWPPDYQILGKDIINFHCVYWPAFLLAANIPLPKRFICHAHWTKDRVKMSKSLKNIIDPVECLKEYSVDMLRFYLLLEGGMENDGDFSFTTLDARVNGDLCNHYGNLVSRSTSIKINPMQVYPKNTALILSENHENVTKSLNNLPNIVKEHFENVHFHKGIKEIFSVIRDCNVFFAENQPWKLAKQKDYEKLETVLYTTYEVLRITSLLLQPIIPTSTEKLLHKFNIPENKRTYAMTKLHAQDEIICNKKLNGDIGMVLFNKIQKE